MTCTAIIVQARMTSTRLPGKVLKPIAGRPMLWHLTQRLRRARAADDLVIATTTNEADEPIVAFCAAEGVTCTRGSEHDVLARYHEAALRVGATTVVRVTSDCPLIDPALVDQALTIFREGAYDYLSNMISPTYPYGMAVEVMTAAALREAHTEARDPAEREHVTPFLYWRPARYRLRSLTREPDLSQHRWTVDTEADLELVRRIVEALLPERPCFDTGDVLALLEEHPDWTALNRHVQQRAVSQAPPKGP